MMQAGQDRNDDNDTRLLDCSMQRRIFLQCQLRARLIVILSLLKTLNVGETPGFLGFGSFE
jgi:hypothetical protein